MRLNLKVNFNDEVNGDGVYWTTLFADDYTDEQDMLEDAAKELGVSPKELYYDIEPEVAEAFDLDNNDDLDTLILIISAFQRLVNEFELTEEEIEKFSPLYSFIDDVERKVLRVEAWEQVLEDCNKSMKKGKLEIYTQEQLDNSLKDLNTGNDSWQNFIVKLNDNCYAISDEYEIAVK